MQIGLVREDAPQRRRDLPVGQDSRGDLIEQRLKQVVVDAVDERHVHLHIRQTLCGGEAAEPAADYHHTGTVGGPRGHSADRLLGVAAELLAHRREHLIGEVVEIARTEAREERAR